mmetsp:Transcript_5585/g.12068  ORF Transcript_5585/g.12068 Transcript_5585/m.12068 type:complete len:200 (+) Transcript_5585:2966-3565(+)
MAAETPNAAAVHRVDVRNDDDDDDDGPSSRQRRSPPRKFHPRHPPQNHRHVLLPRRSRPLPQIRPIRQRPPPSQQKSPRRPGRRTALRLPPKSRLRFRGHPRQFGRFAFLLRQHLEFGHESHGGEFRLFGRLRRQGHELSRVRGIFVCHEVVVASQGVFVAGESRNEGCERMGGALRGEEFYLSVSGEVWPDCGISTVE